MNRIITLFSDPMFEIYCNFPDSTLTSLINLTYLSQPHNPVIYVRYGSLSETLKMLFSGFMQPEFVTKLAVGKVIEFYYL